MDKSHSFCSMSIGNPIPEIGLFQTMTLKLQGQGHGCGQRERSHSWPSILSIHFLFMSHQSDQYFLTCSFFEIWPWKIQGLGHEWGHMIYSVSNRCTSFLFHTNQNKHSAKVFAVADAAETKWKHKVTPDQGDVIMWSVRGYDGFYFTVIYAELLRKTYEN